VRNGIVHTVVTVERGTGVEHGESDRKQTFRSDAT
jgi:hypothetical protein